MKSLKFFSIFFFLFLVTCSLLHVPSALAYVAPQDPLAPGGGWVDDVSPQKLEQEIKSGALSKETSTTHTLNVLTTAGVRMIVGPIQEEASTQGMPYRPGGAIGGVTNLIAAMYANPPASGVEYLADLGRNLGIVSPAYAQQGVGFGELSPILSIWKAFRNIAYLFFIIIFIATGFAIMFRMKISPQAVMTIQSALPRVVIALILVTFSYAIAGFIIDLMYVLLSLGIAALGAGGLFTAEEVTRLQEQFISGGFPQVIGAFASIVGWKLPAGLMLIGGGMGAAVGAFIGGAIASIPMAGIGAIGGAVLALLILNVIILYLLWKLFIELVKAYIGIIFGIILGPLQIMLGVLPGQAGFSKWLMSLLANIMVFPAVAMVLLIGRVLLHRATSGGTFWTPPMMLSAGGTFSIMLPAILGLGILLMVHKIPEMVKQAFGQKPMPYGAAIGETLGAPGRIVGFPAKLVKPVSETLTSAAGGFKAIPDVKAGLERYLKVGKGVKDKEVAPGEE